MAAGNAIIGALRAVLGVDTAQFETGLKAASRSLSGFGTSATKSAALIGAAFTTAVTALATAVKVAINHAEKLNAVSQKIGVPIEQLSALKYAAEQSELSFEGLEKGFTRLSKAMLDAVAKPTGEAADSFRALGISSQFLAQNMDKPTEVMLQLADKFQGLEDGAGKTGIALKLFSKNGTDMIPFLNNGRDGIEQLMDRAKSLGLVIDKETGQAADRFNDKLNDLNKTIQGAVIQFTAGLLQSLEDTEDAIIRVANTGTGFKGWGETVGQIVSGLSKAFERLALEFSHIGSAFSALWNVIKVAAQGMENPRHAWAEFTKVLREQNKEVQALIDRQNDATVAIGTSGDAAGFAAEKKKALATSTLAGKNAIDSFLESQKKSLAAQQAEVDAEGKTVGAKERLRVVLEGLAIATANSIPHTEGLKVKLNEAGAAAELMALKLANIQTLTDNNPLVTLGLQISATNAKLAEGGLAAQDYALLSTQAAQLTAKAWQLSADSFGDSVASIGSSLSQMSNNWSRLAKVGQAIGAAVAFINAYIAASDAFAKAGFPQNIAIAAAVLAKGIAMVAAIKGAVVPKGAGFATGGSFVVPGGSGGGDKVRAVMDLEPGEQVDVWRPDQGGQDPRRGGFQVIQVVAPDITRDYIGAVIDSINGAVRDGYRLELART